MIATASTLPWQGTMAGFRKFTVQEYHKLIEVGVLTEDDNLELLEGYLVHKLSRNPPHDCSLDLASHGLNATAPPGWTVRVQSAVTLAESEPEPDITVARGGPRTFAARHPEPADIGLLIEVADSTLPGDRSDKGRIYARANVPIYWIINLADRQIEVYENPSGPTALSSYTKRTDFHVGDSVPLVLDGNAVARLAVQDLLP